MMRFKQVTIYLILLMVFGLQFPTSINAVYDPLSVPNNKYGIHIIDENDLENAATLVNTSGGDWGYVTIVIAQGQKDRQKWQEVFSRMERLHLIPIIRMATKLENGAWIEPDDLDISDWVQFLSSLPWYTKNRYVVIFNEPNHAKEWGGKIDPESYAKILKTSAVLLKNESLDFFILPAGLDASAPNGPDTMDELTYISRMKRAVVDVFSYIDGWTSHSYPNPGFIGKLTHQGKGTLRTFAWELAYLKSLGVDSNFPVFITETGWPHKEGDTTGSPYYLADKVNDMVYEAANTIWNDERIAAVTPFVLNYQSYPFSQFSWQILGAQDFYPQYDSYRSIPKLRGKPQLMQKEIITPSVKPLIVKSDLKESDPPSQVNLFLRRLVSYVSSRLGS